MTASNQLFKAGPSGYQRTVSGHHYTANAGEFFIVGTDDASQIPAGDSGITNLGPIGSSSDRPLSPSIGATYNDVTLLNNATPGIAITFDGSVWRDASGTTV